MAVPLVGAESPQSLTADPDRGAYCMNQPWLTTID